MYFASEHFEDSGDKQSAQTMLCHGFAYRAWEPWALRARALTNLNMVAKASGPESGAQRRYRMYTEIGITVSELRHGRDRVRSWKQLLTKLFSGPYAVTTVAQL